MANLAQMGGGKQSKEGNNSSSSNIEWDVPKGEG